MKPIELVAHALRVSSSANELVLDPFLGSGTTLIAAEMTGRRCYGLEVDPRYADVIVKRWEEATGEQAKLDGTESTFDEIATQRTEAKHE